MSNKVLIIIMVIIVLIAGGLGVYYFLTNNSNNKSSNNSNVTPTPTQTTTPTTTDTENTNEVSISNMAFMPSTITVKVGTTVIWTNNDLIVHTVTSSTGTFDSGNLSPDAKFSHTFDAVGEFSYACTLHPIMTGKVIVTE